MEELRCLLDMPSLRISYDVANGWLYNQWLGEHDEASVRKHTDYVCACLAAQPCTKILSDHSQLLGAWKSAASWVSQQLSERLTKAGVRYFAWVYSSCYPDRPAMEKILSLTTRPITVIFDDVASAYDWLRRCA